jgi:hypothetical protein
LCSEGSFVNGSSLIAGLESNLDSGLSITGGCVVMMHVLKNTSLLQGRSKEGEVVLLGFMAQHWRFLTPVTAVGFPGPERVITKAEGNILYEIDGQPALDIKNT